MTVIAHGRYATITWGGGHQWTMPLTALPSRIGLFAGWRVVGEVSDVRPRIREGPSSSVS